MRRGPLSDLTQYINPDINNTRVQNAIGSHAFGFQRKAAKPDTYKTVMCQAWLESMKCAFGENCKFAHGEHELRPVRFGNQIRNNLKYKTKLCDKYTTTGICPYGSRCLFIHPAPAKPGAPNQKPPTLSTSPINEPVAGLQQQLEMIRQQYGPNSLPEFAAPNPMQQLWGPPACFNIADVKPGQQQSARPHPNQTQAQFSSRRSFSTSSAPSSAFGSSNSLGSSGGNVQPINWPWTDDLSLTSLSPPFGQTTGTALNAAQLSFHNSLPTFNSHSLPMMRSTAVSEDDAYHSAPMNCTEDEGEQLARSVARALEIDL